MKIGGWSILILLFLILAMILITVFAQFDLLQTRVNQGIGTQVGPDSFLYE